MARVVAVLAAVARLVRRDIGRLGSVAANNFLVFGAILVQSGGFLPMIVALLVLFPLSADPMRRIPPARLAMWPLTRTERWLIRLGGVVLSPTAWVLAGVLIWRGETTLKLETGALVAVIGLLGLAAPPLLRRAPAINPLRSLPAPPGRLGPLIQKNLRELFQSLDAWAGVALCAAGVVARATVGLDRDARMSMAILVVVALSSYAQRLFGRDAEAGLAWYRTAPIRGWEALAAKDAAFLLASAVLTLPLDPIAGLSGSLAALAVGHHQSAARLQPMSRWSFASGALVPDSLFQGVGLIGAAVLASRHSAWALAPVAGIAALSVWFYGRRLEARLSEYSD